MITEAGRRQQPFGNSSVSDREEFCFMAGQR
jgi:hypothetical protein